MRLFRLASGLETPKRRLCPFTSLGMAEAKHRRKPVLGSRPSSSRRPWRPPSWGSHILFRKPRRGLFWKRACCLATGEQPGPFHVVVGAMLNPHRQSVLTNACVKTADPSTRTPGTIYEPKGQVRLLGLISESSPSQQEDYVDAGNGMLICMKRRKKRGPNPPRKACRGPEKTAPPSSDASDIPLDPELTRESWSPTPHSSHAPPSPPPSPETTRPSRPGSFPFHWMWEHVSVKGQAMCQGASPEKAKKKKPPLAASSSVREPPRTPPSSRGATAAKETRRLEGAQSSVAAGHPCRPSCAGLTPRGSLLSLCWTMEARSEARKRQLRQERKRWLHLTQQLLSLEPRRPEQEKRPPGGQLEERLRAGMLCLAAAPEEPGPPAERRRAKARAQPGAEGPTFQPAINRKIPDFKSLQRRFQEQLERKKDQAKVTVCKPFRLHSASGSQQVSGEEDKEGQEDPFYEVWRVRWRAQSCPDFGLPTVPPVMPTKASDKRQEANRLLLLEWERRERQEKRRAELRRAKEQRVQRQVAKCLAAYRTPGQPSVAFQRRREELRRLERQRMEEYSLQLQKMQNRVENRPYLFERVMQENARQAVERRFSQVLAALGLSEEMLRKQAARPSSGRSSAKST